MAGGDRGKKSNVSNNVPYFHTSPIFRMIDFQVVSRERRGRVLKRATFGCLKGVYALYVTSGCGLACTYCYARGYSQAPPKGTVELYANLPTLLHRELASPRRRAEDFVVFNTASDCFQPHPAILDVTLRFMRAVLESGMSLSFLTKGEIPPRFFDLFRQWPDRVMAQIGLVSLSDAYRQQFEPGAAPPARRLNNIRGLFNIGIVPTVRVDPIIPFVTDTEGEIERLMEVLRDLGVTRISLSYLHLRPAIARQLERELAPRYREIIRTCFQNQPWTEVGTATKTKLIPRPLRERGYERIAAMARTFAIKAVICSCKNPDLKGGICLPERITDSRAVQRGERVGRQLTLFPC
jgi:DNA repair photolyase